ncbi:efflux RND transporter periplasmic adaptor subunit [Sporolituus thermophilus]|uniref:Membrane fusion protein, Cu(I)/Ag(I) efflux system n=1 Tax=Sporolituus thermophilus DSM 23256 TaxID=1123285 RepID=A0A1G7KZL5_9FIRM|nr:efflux RND transporter periplasmic adaptor subunit [Sporolituus thermophilus]SDF42514.1 membrane fusion protein, Cu(I)/Ag(I) efflux system [Sporolituus thermophilus DSM 23256]
MVDSTHKKKIIIAGVAVAVIAGGAFAYYNSHKQIPAAATHAGHGGSAAAVKVDGEKVVLDAKARQLAGVQTAVVEKKALTKEIRTTGKIAINENGRAYITSRVMGRVDELYVTAEGEYIEPGQVIAAVYSPDYIAAQEEYILAIDTVDKLRGASRDIVQMNNQLLQAARRKLELLGVPAQDIEHIAHTRQPNTHMAVRAQFGGTVLEKQVLPGAYIMPGEKLYAVSDLSSVWLYVDLYEKDVANVQVGQTVTVTTPAYPGETFTGVVSFINPVLDDATRTVKVRVEMANPAGKLKPNMFAQATIKVPLGETVVIPASSLLDTGKRKIVFVAQGEDTFVKRDIVIGQEANGYIQVLSGLQPGEVVVTAATFLIDSQTQLGNFGSHAGHGGGGKPQAAQPAAVPQVPANPAPSGKAGGEHAGH